MVTFQPNELSMTVQVPITEDTVYERMEHFSVQLSNPVGGEIVIGNDSADVFISDTSGKSVVRQ